MHPVHIFKFCPCCGSCHFKAASERSLKCKDCGFHYFVNASAAVAALVTNDAGELLFTVRAFEPDKGMLDLPGGFVDPGESVEEALYRELKEELNLDVTDACYLVSFPNEYLFSGITVFTADISFVCKVNDLSVIQQADDVSGYVFVSPENVDYSKIGGKSIRKIVKYFIDNIRINYHAAYSHE
ncbi:MAG: NUDIX domain-containing protein [Cytophagaceae bacterium]|jgi:NADH pyrophosphatase NudC (nudix superfamily)|nr:NUDIX domain-containing protein [Cytophagaceae bacterium]